MKNYKLAALIAFSIPLLLICSCKPRTPAALASTVPDTTGYYAARELDGLGYFILGQSTFKETVKKIKAEMRANAVEYRYDPFWEPDGIAYPELKVFKKDTTVFYRDDYLFNDVLACPNNDKIELNKYIVGGLELSHIYLEFYNDTLISINTPDYGSHLGAAFDKKYGESILKVNKKSIEKYGKDEYQVTYLFRIWHNEKVIVTVLENTKYLLVKGNTTTGGRSDYYSNLVIALKNDNRSEEYKKCEDEYKSLYESRRNAIADKKLNEL